MIATPGNSTHVLSAAMTTGKTLLRDTWGEFISRPSWRWEWFITGTFRERKTAPVALRAQVQRGWCPLPKARHYEQKAYIGPGYVGAALKQLVRDMRIAGAGEVGYFSALESHPRSMEQDRLHVHTLMNGCRWTAERRWWIEDWWREHYGLIVKAQPFNHKRGLYVSKYVTKHGRWVASPNLRDVATREQQTLPS